MSQADELLDSLVEDYTSVANSDEPHIIVRADRTIAVPEELKHIAVQYDHNVETVTFDCPRYWDEHDFSKMHVYINYMRPDGHKDQYLTKNLTVDSTDDSIIHFEWVISKNVTQTKGNLSFLVCIKMVNDEGEEEPHWNSRLNQELIVDEGLECHSEVVESNPDIIEELLTRMDNLELAADGAIPVFDLEEMGLTPVPLDGTTVNLEVDCTKFRNALENGAVKVRIPFDVSGTTRYITANALAHYNERLDEYQLCNTSVATIDDTLCVCVVPLGVTANGISIKVIRINFITSDEVTAMFDAN